MATPLFNFRGALYFPGTWSLASRLPLMYALMQREHSKPLSRTFCDEDDDFGSNAFAPAGGFRSQGQSAPNGKLVSVGFFSRTSSEFPFRHSEPKVRLRVPFPGEDSRHREPAESSDTLSGHRHCEPLSTSVSKENEPFVFRYHLFSFRPGKQGE